MADIRQSRPDSGLVLQVKEAFSATLDCWRGKCHPHHSSVQTSNVLECSKAVHCYARRLERVARFSSVTGNAFDFLHVLLCRAN